MDARLRRAAPAVLGLLLFTVALAVLHRQLAEYRFHEVAADVVRLGGYKVSLALVLTAMSYGFLIGYDLLGIRFLRRPLPFFRIALTSFVAYAFSHNLGTAFLSGSAVRLRLYSAWGLTGAEIATVLGLNVVTFWLGFLTLLGAVALFGVVASLPQPAALPVIVTPPVGVACLLAVAAYVILAAVRRTPLRWGPWELGLPSARIAVAQVALSCVDWTVAAAVLHTLLPAGIPLSFPQLLPIFLLAQVAGVASQVPAGLGVFEVVVLHLLAPYAAGSALLGSLVVYRVVYYLLPLLVAAAMLGAHELLQHRGGAARLGRALGPPVSGVVPLAMAAITFLGGVVLMTSGAVPPGHGRLRWLREVVPLPVLEVSHLLGSVAGAGLIVLARGLQRRLNAAYVLAAGLLGAALVFSALRGPRLPELLVLGLLLAAVLPCRREFYRRTSLLDEPFSAPWVVGILLVVLSTLWLLLFSYKHVEYTHELWWQFELSAHAPRSLRATAAAVLLLLGYGGARLLRPVPPDPEPPAAGELAQARAIVEASADTSAYLALLGDKRFLFNAPRTAFVMYGVEGRSWVALRNPIGPPDEVRELAWRFRDLCHRHGGWTVFYETGSEYLPLCLDLGLDLLKLGEEGRVPLATFGLEGSGRKSLRGTHAHLTREGVRFEIVPAGGIEVLLPDLRRISDAWLAEKHTREKGFSLGFFAPEYLTLLPVAVVRRGAQAVAFANLLRGAGREELSVDLMRHTPDAPAGLMDYLFVELMLWGKAEGYRWFNLGMAPLSGLEDRALAPLSSRLGAFLFRHGEHFYNFQGLRQYKEKFDPVWRPHYLASPGGLALPIILANVAALISGGLRGVVAR